MKVLITGCAGFIGSHLLEECLKNDWEVYGIDDFSTGRRMNLEVVKTRLGADKAKNFKFFEGNITNISAFPIREVDIVFHLAALGSVPRSMKDPAETFRRNVIATERVINAALAYVPTQAGIERTRFVFASSSSVYGDSRDDVKKEGREGRVLSPYAMSKKMGEEMLKTYAKCFNMDYVALRYFNVFGHRQPAGSEYSAVIPRFIDKIMQGTPVTIFGDGNQVRDFTYVKNVVRGTILAGIADKSALNTTYNIGAGKPTSINMLYHQIAGHFNKDLCKGVIYQTERKGDVKRSVACIDKAVEKLGYRPRFSLGNGLEEMLG